MLTIFMKSRSAFALRSKGNMGLTPLSGQGEMRVKPHRVWWAATAVLLATLPDIGQACSLADVSLYEQFGTHSKVFLGKVTGRIKDAASGQGLYTIFVDEIFKGLSDNDKREMVVTLSETEQCGLGKPEKNGRILVFMNDGDVVNTTSHSWLIWREAEQTEAHLNPVMDDLVTLRQMLFPKHKGGVVPDEDTALHQALKALIAVFGRTEVSSNMPFTVTYLEERPTAEERVWRIEGTPACPDKKTQHCRLRRYGAEVDRWSGHVVRVFSAD
jgi:hypothetical protein